jgi:hypothetical protein
LKNAVVPEVLAVGVIVSRPVDPCAITPAAKAPAELI